MKRNIFQQVIPQRIGFLVLLFFCLVYAFIIVWALRSFSIPTLNNVIEHKQNIEQYKEKNK